MPKGLAAVMVVLYFFPYIQNMAPFFIEVGVCDFDTCDPLIKNGWNGLMIEPVSYYFDKLKKHDHIFYENVAISDTSGHQDIHFIDPQKIGNDPEKEWLKGVSSLEGGGCFRYNQNVSLFQDCKKQTVNVCTLDDLCKKYNIQSVDFLKIDTEGHDFQVLKSIDLERVYVKMIKIEHKHVTSTKIEKYLRAKKYIVYVEKEDIYAIK